MNYIHYPISISKFIQCYCLYLIYFLLVVDKLSELKPVNKNVNVVSVTCHITLFLVHTFVWSSLGL